MWFSKKIVSDTFFAVFHKIKQEKKSMNREKWIAMIYAEKYKYKNISFLGTYEITLWPVVDVQFGLI